MAYDAGVMTPKSLAAILTQHGKAKSEGSRYVLEGGVGCTLYCSLGTDALTVSATELELGELLVAKSGNETFVLAYEDIRAIRFGGGKRKTGY